MIGLNKNSYSFIISLFFITLAGCVYAPELDNQARFADIERQDLADLYIGQDSPSIQMDVYEAMARAVKYNLGFRISELEKILTEEIIAGKGSPIKPEISAEYGYFRRSSDNFSNIGFGASSGGGAYYSQGGGNSGRLQLSWDILNLGLGYAQLRMAEGRKQIANELHRIALIRLLADVQESYWAVITSQYYDSELAALEVDIEKSIRNFEANGRGQDVSLALLRQERDLLNMKQQLSKVREAFYGADLRFRELIALDPDRNYMLSQEQMLLPVLEYDVNELDEIALRVSPEIRLASARGKISVEQARADILGAFPHLRVGLGSNLTSTGNFTDYGVSVGADLVSLFSLNKKSRARKLKQDIAEKQLQQIAMSVMLRNRLALESYRESLEDFADSLWAYLKERQIEGRIVASLQGGSLEFNELDRLHIRAEQILSGLRSSESFGRIYRQAFETLDGAGLIYVPEVSTSLSLPRLRSQLIESFGAVAGLSYVPLDSASAQIFRQDRSSRNNIERVFEMWRRNQDFASGNLVLYPEAGNVPAARQSRSSSGVSPQAGVGLIGQNIYPRSRAETLADAASGRYSRGDDGTRSRSLLGPGAGSNLANSLGNRTGQEKVGQDIRQKKSLGAAEPNNLPQGIPALPGATRGSSAPNIQKLDGLPGILSQRGASRVDQETLPSTAAPGLNLGRRSGNNLPQTSPAPSGSTRSSSLPNLPTPPRSSTTPPANLPNNQGGNIGNPNAIVPQGLLPQGLRGTTTNPQQAPSSGRANDAAPTPNSRAPFSPGRSSTLIEQLLQRYSEDDAVGNLSSSGAASDLEERDSTIGGGSSQTGTADLTGRVINDGPSAVAPLRPSIPRLGSQSGFGDQNFLSELQDLDEPLSAEALLYWQNLQRRGRNENAPLPESLRELSTPERNTGRAGGRILPTLPRATR